MTTRALLACSWIAVAAVATGADSGHDHRHPTEGPHHGRLIELGREDYHAEIVHDHGTNAVTIYLLDADAKQPVPIDAKQLTLNLVVAGKPRQFPLAAVPQPADPQGKSSAFGATSEPLTEALDARETTGRLNVLIGGRVFVGTVGGRAHDHPHP